MTEQAPASGALGKAKTWWKAKAQPWFKANWQWLAAAGGAILAARFLRQAPPEVVVPELVGAEAERLKAEEEASKQRVIAELERQDALKVIRTEHAEVVKQLTDEQKFKVTELEKDPEALNSFLKGVGKAARK